LEPEPLRRRDIGPRIPTFTNSLVLALPLFLLLAAAAPVEAEEDGHPTPAEITLTSGRSIINGSGIVRLQSYVARIGWTDSRRGMATLGLGSEESPPGEILPEIDRIRARVEYLSPISGKDVQRAPAGFVTGAEGDPGTPFAAAGLAFVALFDDETDTPIPVDATLDLSLTIRFPESLSHPGAERPLAEGDTVEVLALDAETGRWLAHAETRVEATESGLQARFGPDRSGWYMLGWLMPSCDESVAIRTIDACGNPLAGAELVLSSIRASDDPSREESGSDLRSPAFAAVLQPSDGRFDLAGLPAGMSLHGFLRRPAAGPAVGTDNGRIRIDDCRIAGGETAVHTVLDAADTSKGIYVWPGGGRKSRSSEMDSFLTSFGPRVRRGSSELHRGIDIPDLECVRRECTELSKPVHAVYEGTVCCAGIGGQPCVIAGEALSFDSPHIVIRSHDPVRDHDLFQVYEHLDRLDVAGGDRVKRGLKLGTVGDDGGESPYPHLHFELRKGSPKPTASVHPLRYLRYSDTGNFSAAELEGPTGVAGYRRVRLRFGAPDSDEGDLLGVEVDFFGSDADGSSVLLENRSLRVDLEDEDTLPLADGDDCRFRDGIALEGYQTSDMQNGRWRELEYGILVAEIPAQATAVQATVIDVAGNRTLVGPLQLPNGHPIAARGPDLTAVATIEPPWSLSSRGTLVDFGGDYGRDGAPGLRARDESRAMSFQHAGIVRDLPAPVFDLTLEADFRLASLRPKGAIAHPLYLRNADEQKLALSAFGRNASGETRAGLAWRATITGEPQERIGRRWSSLLEDGTLDDGAWRRWRLQMVRLGTRTATARLFVGDMAVEQVRTVWSSGQLPPQQLRAGLGLTGEGATAEIRMSGLSLVSDPAVDPGSCLVPNTPRGLNVHVALTDPSAPGLAADLTVERIHRTGWTSLARLEVGPDPPAVGLDAKPPFDRPFEIATTALIPDATDLEICLPASPDDPAGGTPMVLQYAEDESGSSSWVDLGAGPRDGRVCVKTRSLAPLALRIG
jgi:hypothetical protein